MAWSQGYEHEPQRHCDIAVGYEHRATLMFFSTLCLANASVVIHIGPMFLLAQASDE